MKVLLDSNVILRLFQPNHPHSPIAEVAILQLEQLGFSLCLVRQNIYEFWVVATRPVGQNGLGLSSDDARESVDGPLRQVQFLRDERGVFGNWISLVTQHQAIGKNAHDARLAAAMERHSIANLLTFNGADFKRFSSIQILDPAEIVAGKLPTS
jgi:predicted nucleic acid-binding protein